MVWSSWLRCRSASRPLSSWLATAWFARDEFSVLSSAEWRWRCHVELLRGLWRGLWMPFPGHSEKVGLGFWHRNAMELPPEEVGNSVFPGANWMLTSGESGTAISIRVSGRFPIRLSSAASLVWELHTAIWDYPFALFKESGGTKSWRWHFSFLNILLSSASVFAVKFPQKSQKSAKSCVVSSLKGQLFVLKYYGICKSRLKY